MLQPIESSGSTRRMTNVDFYKELEEQKKSINEKSRLLDEALVEMKEKLKEVVEASLTKEDGEISTSKEKKKLVSIEDEVLEPDP